MKTRSILMLTLFALNGTAAEPAKPDAKVETFAGKVHLASKVALKPGGKIDPAAKGVVLVMSDGTTHAIVKNEGSRMFDAEAMHDRTVQLSARVVEDPKALDVITIHTVKDGKLHEVFYWCANCSFRNYQPGPCLCCSGDTVLTEVPVKTK